jgi:transcriptional regulator with XRE-family HTH domain
VDYPSRILILMRGRRLRAIRGKLNLTQAQLAERLGVASNTVARWERNEIPIRESMARLIQLVAKVERKRSAGR